MVWVKLDDGFCDHPKIEPLTDAAFRAYVAALCYCNRFLTDGALTAAKTERLAGPTVRRELVEAGLWHEQKGGGIVVHDFHDRQPTRARVEQDRVRNAARQQAWRERNGVTNGVSHGVSNSAPARPVPKEQKPLSDKSDVTEVFEYWQQARNKPRRKLTGDRERKIRARLKDGYTVAELKLAVDGVAKDPWEHRAANDDIGTICRDAQHVDRFLAFMENGLGNGSGPMMAANHHVWGHTPHA